jgi:hypothetical protein
MPLGSRGRKELPDIHPFTMPLLTYDTVGQNHDARALTQGLGLPGDQRRVLESDHARQPPTEASWGRDCACDSRRAAFGRPCEALG